MGESIRPYLSVILRLIIIPTLLVLIVDVVKQEVGVCETRGVGLFSKEVTSIILLGNQGGLLGTRTKVWFRRGSGRGGRAGRHRGGGVVGCHESYNPKRNEMKLRLNVKNRIFHSRLSSERRTEGEMSHVFCRETRPKKVSKF